MKRSEAGAGIVALAIAAGVLVLGSWLGTGVGGGSDSSGYVSQANLWLRDTLIQPQPWIAEVPWPNAAWTFSPLGYRPLGEEGAAAIVPTYAPGLPMLMAGASLVGGPCAVFAVTPIAGSILVLATFVLGLRLADATTGLVAAWLVAVSPAFLYMLTWAMSDVPVAAAWAVALVFLFAQSAPAAAAAGAATAVAILIRPNHLPGAAILGLWYLRRVWQSTGEERRAWLGRGSLFAGFAALGALAAAAIQVHLYGSPLTTGYGGVDSIFDAERIGANLRRYPRWLVESETPLAMVGLASLLIPLRKIWPFVPDRAAVAVLGAFVLSLWAQYATYLVFDDWWYLRFLLATWPPMMLGSAAMLTTIGRAMPVAARLVIAAALVALGVRQWTFAADHGLQNLWKQEWRYEAAARLVESMTEPGSVVLAMQHSGSLRIYGDRVTLRYDILDPEWLDRAIAWLGERGVHAYLLVDEGELGDFRRRYPTQATVARANRPLLTWIGTNKVFLYDLQRERDPAEARIVEADEGEGQRCERAPTSAPTLRFH